MGVDDKDEPGRPPGDGLLGFRNRVIAGVVFGATYLAAFAIHGTVLPGIVGGILSGVLLYLVLREADERKRRKRR